MEQYGDGLLSPTYEENCTHPTIYSQVFEIFLQAGVCMIALQIRKPKLKSTYHTWEPGNYQVVYYWFFKKILSLRVNNLSVNFL